MAIDDRLEAARKQLEAELRTGSPVTTLVADVAVGLIPVAGTVISFLTRRRFESIEYMLDCLRQELSEIGRRFDELPEPHQEFLKSEEFKASILDGFQKTENVRAKDRIQRMAAILGSAAGEGEASSFDRTEEFLRIAMDLSDDDVRVLRQLDTIGGSDGQRTPTVDDANAWWGQYNYRVRGMDDNATISICLKLESFGLVQGIERRAHTVGPQGSPFRILDRGRDFVLYIRSRG